MAESGRLALSPGEFAAAQQELEQVLPLMQEAAAETLELEVARLRESSCLRPEIKEQHEETRWEGLMYGSPADAAAANSTVDNLVAALQAQGWAVSREENAPDQDNGTVRKTVLRHGKILITVTYVRKGMGPEHTLELLARTQCTVHSEDHQMLRSPLDPSYGRSNQYYPDGA